MQHISELNFDKIDVDFYRYLNHTTKWVVLFHKIFIILVLTCGRLTSGFLYNYGEEFIDSREPGEGKNN